MMTRTCTVQANFDYFNENDLIKKFVLANRLQPIVMAIFCNSPFREGSYNSIKSNRIYTWQDTDSERCGIKEEFLDQSFNVEKYVDFVLKVKNYFLKINGKYVDTTAYSFHELMSKTSKEESIREYNLTINDWINHLSTIFTEVRLKSYLEVRGADAGKWEMICALPAFWTGIFYDEENLDKLWNLTNQWNKEDILQLYYDVAKNGLKCHFNNQPLHELGKMILDISTSGLKRRGYLNSDGEDESIHLEKLKNIIDLQKTPADVLIDDYNLSKNVISILDQPYY
jgi:glutamate--cysteine ligase